MAKFSFHMGVDIRAYGNVEAEALTVDDAVKLLTPDYVAENIERTETTWDGVSNLSIIDAHSAETGEMIEEWSGVDLLPPPPTEPDGVLIHVSMERLPGRVWCFVGGMHPNPRAAAVGMGFVLGIATLGEAGWSPAQPVETFASYEAAAARAEALNDSLPWAKSCDYIIADTMARSRSKLKREDGRSRFKVTIDFGPDDDNDPRRDRARDRDSYETKIAEEIEELLKETLFANDGMDFPGWELPEFTVEVI